MRIHSHSNSDRHELYRSPEELAAARARDPLPKLRSRLLADGLIDAAELAALEAANVQAYEECAARVREAPDPDPASIHDFLLPEPWRPEGDGLATIAVTPAELAGVPLPERSLLEAVNLTLKELFRENLDAYLWGQDVASREGRHLQRHQGMQRGLAPAGSSTARSPRITSWAPPTASPLRRPDPGRRRGRSSPTTSARRRQMVEMSHESWRTWGQFVPNV